MSVSVGREQRKIVPAVCVRGGQCPPHLLLCVCCYAASFMVLAMPPSMASSAFATGRTRAPSAGSRLVSIGPMLATPESVTASCSTRIGLMLSRQSSSAGSAHELSLLRRHGQHGFWVGLQVYDSISLVLQISPRHDETRAHDCQDAATILTSARRGKLRNAGSCRIGAGWSADTCKTFAWLWHEWAKLCDLRLVISFFVQLPLCQG